MIEEETAGDKGRDGLLRKIDRLTAALAAEKERTKTREIELVNALRAEAISNINLRDDLNIANARIELLEKESTDNADNLISCLVRQGEMTAELAAERERAIHQTSIACRAIEENANLRAALEKMKDELPSGFLDAVLKETAS